MSPGTLLKDARLWIALVLFTVLSLILVWWFWYPLEAARAMTLVTVDGEEIKVDGVQIEEEQLREHDREKHGHWKLFKTNREEHFSATAVCSWNSYDTRDALIPFSIPPIFYRLVASMRSKTGREPEWFRWEDGESYPRVGAIWQFTKCHVEIVAAENNDNDSVRLSIIAAPLEWESETTPVYLKRLNVRHIDERDVNRFLSFLHH